MEKESKEGRKNGEENDTNDTKEGENTQTADNEVAEKCGVERDTENGVDQNVDDGIETDACQGPEVLPGAGLDPHTEDASVDASGKTDEEESGGPQTTDSSSEPKENKPKTESEEEKRATEKGAQGAAATEHGTKQDGTTKQKAKEEGVEAGGTELPTEDAKKSFEHVSKERPVSISVCTSASDFNVNGLVSFLKDLMKDHPELIKEVKAHALPYSDLDHYTFPEENPVDVMLLCHSKNNRSFAITDVEDALYDEYLPYCQSVIGKNKIGVIVHDFDDVSHTVQSSRMGSFRSKQPMAFETTSLQITCGHIEKKEQVLKQMQTADREKLLEFLKNASNFPEEMTEQVTKSRGLLKTVWDVIVSCGQMASSAIRSFWGSDTLVGRSQDSTSEGSSVDPSEADRNDHVDPGTTQVETSGMVPSQDGDCPQAAADSQTEFDGIKGSGKKDEEEIGESQIADHSTALPEGSEKRDEEESGESQVADHSTALPEYSKEANGEERGESQIADHSTALSEGSEKTGSGKKDEEESGEPQIADHSTALPEGSEPKTDEEKSGEPQITDHSTALSEGSEPITGEEESGEPQIADHSTALPEGSEPKTDEEESGGSQIADHSTALLEGSKKTGSGKKDEEEIGESQIADHSTALPEGSEKRDEEESGESQIADHSTALPEYSKEAAGEERGESQIADHSTALPEGSEKTGSEKTDEEESGEPQIADLSTALPEGSEKTDEEEESGQSQIAGHSTAPHEGSEKTDEEESGEPQIAESSSEPKEITPKTGAGLDPFAEGAREGSGKTDEKEKGEPKITDSSSESKDSTSQLVMKEILTDKLLLSLSKRINLKNVPAESFSVYLGFSAADGAAAVIGAISTMNPQSAFNTLLSKFVMRNGRNSEIALNLRKRFLDNGMKDYADVIKAELDKFKIPVPSDEETLVDTLVIIPSPPFGRPVPRNPTTNPTTPDRIGSKDSKDKEGARERKTEEKSEEEKRAITGGSTPIGRPVLRNPTTSPSALDRNSGSKDPNDKKEARERKAKEMSEEKKRATENKANELKLSKEGAAAAGNGTKEDGTTNQKADNERVKEDDTNLPAEPIEHIIERPVSISVCTSAYDFSVKGLVSFLKDLMKDHPELIKEVKVHALPYNDLDHYKFPKENPVDVMLLCHSINNRRFAITDVMDALYDEYLPYCARVVGKNKMGVIVHDFEDMRETVQSSRMSSFKYKQPKAFETTSLQIICGNIENEDKVLNQMLKADREKLPEFLKNASKFPEQMKEDVNANPSLLTLSREKYHEYKAQLSSFFSSSPESNTQRKGTHDESRVDPVRAEVKDDGNRAESREISGSQTKRKFGSGTQPSYLPKKGKSGGFHQTPQASMDPPWDASPMGQRRSVTSNTAATAHSRGSPSQQPMASRKTFTSAPQISTPSPRRISVSVCSSAYEQNVQGFMSQLTKLLAAQPHVIADVRFRGLPYNDIDSFKFPSNDPVDVMVLCHSTRNRGLSITNTLNALYDKYLQYCHDVIGKKKLAVIVHDFSDCKPKTLEVRMESFRRSQPLTFELADTVIVCGSLDKPGKVEMRDEDITRLTTFFEQARYEQRENYAVKQSFYKKSFLGIFG